MNGKLIIFSAPSGSGKTTIVRHLLSLDIGLAFSVSATSRTPRINETDSIDYHFLSPDAFRKKIDKGEFLEWEEVYKDQYYGTLRSEVENMLEKGKHVLFDIDVVGGLNLKREFGNQSLAIFVQPPSLSIMEQRLRERGTDSEEQILKRVAKAEKELSYADQFDKLIVNDNLTDSLKMAEQVVREFINQPDRQ